MQYDQDIVDLLTSLKPSSVTGEGGMYAAAMPPPPPEAKPEVDDSLFSLRGPAAEKLQVLFVLSCITHFCRVCVTPQELFLPLCEIGNCVVCISHG